MWISEPLSSTFPIGPDIALIETATFLSHRYWSVNVTAHTGATEVGIIELEFAKLGGVDNTGGTASATSTFGSFVADNTIDNSLATQWIASSGTHPQRLSVDFAISVDVNVVRLKGRGFTNPGAFTVDYSDNGSAWTTAWTCTNVDLTQDDPYLVSFPDPACTVGGKVLWRLAVTLNEAGNTTRIAEIELRDAIGGTDKTAIANKFWVDGHATNTGDLAFDNDAATFWNSSIVNGGKWFYEFEGSLAVKELMLQADVGAPSRAPKSFTLAYSADGVTWTTVLTVTNDANWSSGETRTYTISA